MYSGGTDTVGYRLQNRRPTLVAQAHFSDGLSDLLISVVHDLIPGATAYGAKGN